MGEELSIEEQLKQGIITPGQPIPLYQNIELQFQDEKLNDLKEQSRQFQLTESAGSSRKLVVTVEGIHTGMTKNKTFYPGNTLEESVPTWTSPHRKPVIKNHNLYEEPLGRIVQAEYVESTLTDKYTVRLKLEITDEKAIEKILDGRYLTLSVGGSADKVTCNACGKDLVQEGYCGHRRGKAYDGKEAYWIIGNYTGDEISFVNQPADVHSQVIQAELVTAEGGKNVKDGKTKEGVEGNGTDDPTQVKESATGSDDATNLIDGLLSEGDNNDGKPDTPVTEGQDDNSDTDNPDTPDATKPKESGDDADKDLETVKKQLEDAQKEVDRLTKVVEDKDTEITTLTATVSEKSTKLETTEKHLESAENEKKTLVEQNITLARFARKSMAERVADLRIVQGKNKADEREALITEWSQSSSKVLETQITDLLGSAQRHVEHIASPGQVIAEKNAPIVDEDDEEIVTQKESKKTAEQKPKTLKDFEGGLKRSMFRTT